MLDRAAKRVIVPAGAIARRHRVRVGCQHDRLSGHRLVQTGPDPFHVRPVTGVPARQIIRMIRKPRQVVRVVENRLQAQLAVYSGQVTGAFTLPAVRDEILAVALDQAREGLEQLVFAAARVVQDSLLVGSHKALLRLSAAWRS